MLKKLQIQQTEAIQIKNNPLNTISKYSDLKFKKTNVPVQKQKLYSQNLSLKNKIKQLMHTNTQIKTQLTKSQQQKIDICIIAEEEIFNPKTIIRSKSSVQRKSFLHLKSQASIRQNRLLESSQNIIPAGLSANFVITQQKNIAALKKILRDQKIQNNKLCNQLNRLKQTIKFTRMNEILAQNTQMSQQMGRLRTKLQESNQIISQMQEIHLISIQQLKKKLKEEQNTDKKSQKNLKQQLTINEDLKNKLKQALAKIQQTQRRTSKEIKMIKTQNNQLKDKLLQQKQYLNKECQRHQCLQMRLSNNQLKKKVQQLNIQLSKQQKQLQKVKEDFQIKQYEYTKIKEQKEEMNLELTDSKQIIKKLNKSIEEKEKEKDLQIKAKGKKKRSQANIDKSPSKKSSDSPRTQSNIQKRQVKNQKYALEQTKKKSQAKGTVSTSKQVQSIELSKAEVRKNQSKNNQTVKNENIGKKQNKMYVQSEGQYQQLSFQEEQNHIKKQSENKQKQAKKQKIKEQNQQIQIIQQQIIASKPLNSKQKVSQQNQKSQKQAEKNQSEKQKHTKGKKSKNQEASLQKPEKKQQLLKQAEQPQKGELKLIRQTLLYKFKGQRYTYDNFCQDIKKNNIKQFSIAEILELLADEPFMLKQQHVQIVVIYLFDTNQLTGEESLSRKDFIKKMKKFIGKASAVDQQKDNQNIDKIKKIIQKDQSTNKKLLQYFFEGDSGDGTVTKQVFTKGMAQIGIKSELLQTALAQAIYISEDANHIRYQMFVKRFTDEQ